MSEKVCNKCGQEQGLNAFPKVKGKGGKTYYRNTCKNCRRDYDKAWKNANTEHVKQWRKKHYQENREKILSRVAIWQAENKEHKFAYQREWYLLNRDERLAKQKKWYGTNQDKVRDYVSKNKDAIASRMKSWREANAESIEEYNLEWREKNRTHIQKYSQDYHSGNPQVKRVSENKRRAQKRRSKGAFSWEDVERLYILQVGMCVYCEADLSDKFEIDHITPLSRGGDNSAENIQLTCPPCNRGKHAKTHDEYLEFLKRRRVSN